ncbi:MAG: electron transfer flavoprotein subunit alpha/FixB family protein [Bacillota bacterium]
MAKGIWVFAEQRNGQLRKVSYEMISAGMKYGQILKQEVDVVVIGSNISGVVEEIAKYGVNKVFAAEHPQLESYTTDGYASVLADLVKEHQPEALFMGNTAIGKDLAPRVAERVGAGLITDCIAVELQGTDFIFTRPIYAGKAFAKVMCPTARPVMATFRPNVLGIDEMATSEKPQLIQVEVKFEDGAIRTKVREVLEKSTGRVELTEADIIVSGGRGMKGPENFAILEQLADTIGAAVGASRAAVDAGWREHQYQVGQTGKTVSPTLYIACGISGAIQHLAGMSSSKYIVAINKDPEANIFKVADYGIADDLFKVVPALTEEVKKIL